MLSSAQLAALKRATYSSVSCEQITRLPAELTLAQWALESAWGQHQPGNNCFGIKAYNGCFGVQRLETFEIVDGVRQSVLQNFATFRSLEACFHKHADLLTGTEPYQSAWTRYLKTKDLDKLVRGIAQIYATDPNYSKILFEIISMPQVQIALADARRDKLTPGNSCQAA
ncbi:MAG: glucosaminidase domain-containing protein [Acidobacteriaceae bacterium]|nr:glucosaminidase domain-containing protein [Acidobacteriaceae bacterium]